MNQHLTTHLEAGAKPSRKPRSDKGSIQATKRDLLVLRWIADQYAARVDQIQELLSLYPGAPMKEELISDAVTKDQIKRWMKAGWIENKRVLADAPGWVWLTKKGLQLLDLDDIFTARTPAATRLNHIYAVNEIRLMLDENYSWVGERLIRSEMEPVHKGESSGPIPDAYLKHKNGKIAIEVEITQKKPNDLADKLFQLAYYVVQSGIEYHKAYPAIWVYVPNERIKRAVESARERLRDEHQERISIVSFELD